MYHSPTNLCNLINNTTAAIAIVSHDSVVIYQNESYRKLTETADDTDFWASPFFKAFDEEYLEEMKTYVLNGRPWQFQCSYKEEKYDGYILPDTNEQKSLIFIKQINKQWERIILYKCRQDKFQALTIMAKRLSHDFNNLISVVLGGMDMISGELKEDSPMKKLASEIKKSAQNHAKRVKKLMTFIPNQAKRPPIDITETVRAFVHDTAKNAPGKVRFISSVPSRPLYSEITHNELKIILNNMMINAIENTPEIGGRIGISLAKATPYELPPYCPRGAFNLIKIKDEGVGIKPEYINKIFDPYFTAAKKPGKNTGLGLSQVYGIVTSVNGYIFAEPKTKGVVFSVLLPESKNIK